LREKTVFHFGSHDETISIGSLKPLLYHTLGRNSRAL
jgi:hypothetical protein